MDECSECNVLNVAMMVPKLCFPYSLTFANIEASVAIMANSSTKTKRIQDYLNVLLYVLAALILFTKIINFLVSEIEQPVRNIDDFHAFVLIRIVASASDHHLEVGVFDYTISGSSRKSSTPIFSTPLSSYHRLRISCRMMILGKESPVRAKGLFSICAFCSSGRA